MIRREIQLPGEDPQWLLISQVEHARLSGVLAEHCHSHLPKVVRTELLQAIIHHDDGWAAWETNPQLDDNGRPLSFRELELKNSLAIWTDSIEAAGEFGPLAAWCVAGHFLALLNSSDKLLEFATAWRDDMLRRQTDWLSVWQTSQPQQHTLAIAESALKWLQLFDVMSLWVCSVCPGLEEQVTQSPEDYHVGKGEPLESRFSFVQGRPIIEPWRFDQPSLQLEAAGWVVPQRKYTNSDELLAARKRHVIRWDLAS